MYTDSFTAKALLGMFLLSAQLCPCPAAAMETPEPAPATSHHGPEAKEDCHGEPSRLDCGMADMAETDAAAGKLVSPADTTPAAHDSDSFSIACSDAHRQRSDQPPPCPGLPAETPVTFADRMLD